VEAEPFLGQNEQGNHRQRPLSEDFVMRTLLDFPLVVFALSLAAMWLATQIGIVCRKRLIPLQEGEQQDFDLVVPGTLTLLGLIIGFSFSVVTGRYDQRKNYEEAEANAIGTEYLRADLLPTPDAAKVRDLLKKYLDERVLFYKTRDSETLAKVNRDTAELQSQLWSAVRAPSAAQPTPVVALAVSGMNDVLNSQGYTQAAWWYRLPTAGWSLMFAIALFSTWLIGYGSHRRGVALFQVLPLVVSISFLLIADIDSPRRGFILVIPQNLISLSQSLQAP
jgi:hypothetical protein